MLIMHTVGARPNFMKLAPVFLAFEKHPGVEQKLIHTGQHYDFNMSEVFFQQLGIREPDFYLAVGSSSHSVQTAEIMMRIEQVLLKNRPDWLVVYGDVNSTVAAALVCAKMGIKVAHVEAGLRSFDRTMPEEINRLVTDQLADLLLTPSEDGNVNLAREGVSADRVHMVGNVMIDTLCRFLAAPEAQRPANVPDKYVLVTLHRPSNVDDNDWLITILRTLEKISRDVPVVFPVHPRTRARLEAAGYKPAAGTHVELRDPAPYLEFLGLQRGAVAVVTDSGGIQEETTYLGIPCLTLRENTERPVTMTLGTNRLIGRDLALLERSVKEILAGNVTKGAIPPLWDAKAGERIAAILTGTAQASQPIAASAARE